MSLFAASPAPGDKPDHPLVETAFEGPSGGGGWGKGVRMARVGLEQAQEIAARYAAKETLFHLATSYGLGVICIRRIVVKQGGIIRLPGIPKKPSNA
jgi:hypothetical protein